MGFLSDIARQVDLLDVLDMVLVSAVIYMILAWLRGSIPESATRRIFVAAPIAAILYILVRVFDLYLLETLVRVLFIVMLIVAVVVFQSDIRRMFDRAVTLAGSGRRTPAKDGSSAIDIITEAASKMAEMRIGALIAIRGREPLDSHIHGGIKLGGYITQPLLFGIFHPETPGHDGAVIVERDRVLRFAVHLPLAPDVPEVSRFGGTRHAAALGLAEESDAMVVVVSEERGTIGVAQHGSLMPDIDASELKGKLEAFWAEHYRPHEVARLSWWKRRSMQTATVSVMLSVLFWLLVVYSPNTVIRTLEVPIEIRNLPQGWSLDGDIPSEAEVVLSGPEQVFRRLNAPDLAISIDASNPETGAREIVIAEDDLNLPAGVDLNRVEPQVVEVSFYRQKTVRVPVQVRTKGSFPAGLTLSSLRSEPDSILVMIPEDETVPEGAVHTQEIDLSAITGDTEVRTRLVLPEHASLPTGATSEVLVHVDISRSTPLEPVRTRRSAPDV